MIAGEVQLPRNYCKQNPKFPGNWFQTQNILICAPRKQPSQAHSGAFITTNLSVHTPKLYFMKVKGDPRSRGRPPGFRQLPSLFLNFNLTVCFLVALGLCCRHGLQQLQHVGRICCGSWALSAGSAVVAPKL